MAHRPVTRALLASVLAGPAAARDGTEVQRWLRGCLAAFGPNTNPACHRCVANRCTAPAPSLRRPVAPTRPGDWGDIGGLIQGTLAVARVR